MAVVLLEGAMSNGLLVRWGFDVGERDGVVWFGFFNNFFFYFFNKLIKFGLI